MAIKFNNVFFKYDINNKDYTINNFNIELEDNKIYGLIGKSGSGKTTILELIDGLILPTKGSIDFDNISNIKKEIGFIFQFPEEQFFENNVKKEISFALKNFDMSFDKLSKVLKIVGLKEEILNKKLDELSNGERRMVAIASVLVYNPKIIMFDEPTIGLDYNNKKKLIRLIKALKDRYNKTVIIVSHDIDFLYQIIDKLIAIENGKLLCYDEKYNFYNNDKIIKEHNIPIPKILLFEKLVEKDKNIKLLHSTTVNDLIKEVYRNV